MADAGARARVTEDQYSQLSNEDGWALLNSMTGMWAGQFEADGGADSFVRWLRDEVPS